MTSSPYRTDLSREDEVAESDMSDRRDAQHFSIGRTEVTVLLPSDRRHARNTSIAMHALGDKGVECLIVASIVMIISAEP